MLSKQSMYAIAAVIGFRFGGDLVNRVVPIPQIPVIGLDGANAAAAVAAFMLAKRLL